MLPRFINIGPLTIHLYGLIIASAVFAGWYLAKKRSHIFRIPKTIFEDPVLIIPLFLAIIGARAYHVADYWEIYSKNLPSIFAIQNGGLGIWGSLVGILAGFWIVSKVKKLSFLSIVDLVSPSLLLGQAIGRFGNFINQEAFGPPTDLPWAVYINPENRPAQFLSSSHFHPTFFYEAILDLIFFLLLLKFSQMSKVKGQLFALYLILYSTGRFIAEFWRIDTWMVDGLKVAHILSIIGFLIGIWLFFRPHGKTIKGSGFQ